MAEDWEVGGDPPELEDFDDAEVLIRAAAIIEARVTDPGAKIATEHIRELAHRLEKEDNPPPPKCPKCTHPIPAELDGLDEVAVQLICGSNVSFTVPRGAVCLNCFFELAMKRLSEIGKEYSLNKYMKELAWQCGSWMSRGRAGPATTIRSVNWP